MEVLKLLKSKNRCLERFLGISEAHFSDFQRGDFSGLQDFQVKRDAILRAVRLFDDKIAESIGTLEKSILDEVRRLDAQKDHCIKKILALDGKIIKVIETESRRVMEEIRTSSRSREKVGKFKSSWVSRSGKGLDKTL